MITAAGATHWLPLNGITPPPLPSLPVAAAIDPLRCAAGAAGIADVAAAPVDC